MRWARWNREGWRSQTHLSCAKPPPGLQDGEHLSVAEAAIYLTAAKTNSETEACERKNIDAHLQGEEGEEKNTNVNTSKDQYLSIIVDFV